MANPYQNKEQQQQHQVIRQPQQQQHQSTVLLSQQQHQTTRPSQPGLSHQSQTTPSNNTMPTISLLPYSVPISGPIVRLSSLSKVPPDTNGLPLGFSRQQQQPRQQVQPHNNHQAGLPTTSRDLGGVSVQHLLQISNAAGNQLRMGTAPRCPVFLFLMHIIFSAVHMRE